MTPRIIVDDSGAALHVLRPGEPPEIHRLAITELSRLAREASEALDDALRRRPREVQRVPYERPGTPFIGRMGE